MHFHGVMREGAKVGMGEHMKALGTILITLSVVLLLMGATMDVGYHGYANLDLMNRRSNLLMVGGGLLIGGIIALGFGFYESNGDQPRRSRASGEFRGNRDLNNAAYKEFLVDHYDIHRNDVLGEFILGERSFPILEQVLIEADRRHTAELELAKTSQEKNAAAVADYWKNPDYSRAGWIPQGIREKLTNASQSQDK